MPSSQPARDSAVAMSPSATKPAVAVARIGHSPDFGCRTAAQLPCRLAPRRAETRTFTSIISAPSRRRSSVSNHAAVLVSSIAMCAEKCSCRRDQVLPDR